MTVSRTIANLSKWIDESPANATRDPEALTWGRLAKVQEEAGEVIAAYIGVTGQNPRKGVHGGIDDVKKELLDVAVSALTAFEHVTGNKGTCILALMWHIDTLRKRANLEEL